MFIRRGSGTAHSETSTHAWVLPGTHLRTVRHLFAPLLGIFDVPILPYVQVSARAVTGFPFGIFDTINLATHPGTFPKGALSLLTFGGVNNTTTVGYTDQNPPRSYTMNWNLNVQRNLGGNTSILIGYVGMHAVHQDKSTQDINGVYGTLTSAGWLWPFPVGSGTVLDPNVGDIRSLLWYGSAYYHALEGQVSKRMAHGIQAQLSYTWGHCIDQWECLGDTFTNSDSAPSIFSNPQGTLAHGATVITISAAGPFCQLCLVHSQPEVRRSVRKPYSRGLATGRNRNSPDRYSVHLVNWGGSSG